MKLSSKSFFAKFTLVLVLLIIFAFNVFVEASSLGEINVNGLNVRKSASLQADIITKLSKGTEVAKTETSGEWTKIQAGNSTGWVYSKYITNKTYTASVTENLNLRSSASISSSVITIMPKGSNVKVISGNNTWCNVEYKGKTGWVSAQFVKRVTNTANRSSSQTISKTGLINTTVANVRSTANIDSAIVIKLQKGQKVSITASEGNWYKISVNGKVGWIAKSLIKIQAANTSRGTDVEREDEIEVPDDDSLDGSKSELANSIISLARKYMGVRYVYGGSSPNGFDCSGFAQYIYSKNGIKINRTAAQQSKQGVHVKKSDLKPGDLVFFDTDGRKSYINHVGIYIGSGRFIHASSGRRRVIIGTVNEGSYLRYYMTARRYF
jgi:cell wall-associated NlpC family hydrolase